MKKTLLAGLAMLSLGFALSSTTASAKKFPDLNTKDILYTTNNNNYYVDDSPVSQLVANQDINATVDGSNDQVQIKSGTTMTIQTKNNDQTQVTVPGQSQKLWVSNISQVTYPYQNYTYTKKDYQNLTKDGKKWAKQLSSKTVKTIGDYTGDGYRDINSGLRNPNQKISKKTKTETKQIRNALVKFNLKKPLTVYRGINEDAYKAGLAGQPNQIGSIYSDKAFGSTSILQSVANTFQNKVLLKINIPTGNYGSYIASISQNKQEKEFLLNPDVKLVVTRIQNVKADGTMTIQQYKDNKLKYHYTKDAKSKYQLVTLTPTK